MCEYTRPTPLSMMLLWEILLETDFSTSTIFFVENPIHILSFLLQVPFLPSSSLSFTILSISFPFPFINTVGIHSKTCLWPITDTECQLWEQMLKSIFLKLFLWLVQMSLKNIATIFLNIARSTNIIYLFSEITNCLSIFNKNSCHFHNNTRFRIFVHFTN